MIARGEDGATTVAATSHLAERAGIRVFATGGLGGVHRGAQDTFDESADLGTLARAGICVVCAGVKSILDIPATLERLETLNVTVLGYRDGHVPGLLPDSSSGVPVTWRVDSPAKRPRRCVRARHEVGAPGGVVVANPLDEQMDAELHERVLREGLQAADEAGVKGRDITPFLLERFHSRTGGREPARERPARAAQRRAGRGDRRRAVTRIVVLGDLNVDVVAVQETLARARQRHPRARVAACRAAAGANVAAWLAKLGVDVTLIGARGRRRRWRRSRSAGSTAWTCRSCVTRSARPGPASCSSRPAASARCSRTPAPTTRSRSGTCRRCEGDVLHVSGYSLMRPGSRAAALAAIDRAREAGMKISVDPASAAPLANDPVFLQRIAPIDLLLPNADEAAVLGPQIDVPELVVKFGADGARWTNGVDTVIGRAVAGRRGRRHHRRRRRVRRRLPQRLADRDGRRRARGRREAARPQAVTRVGSRAS